MRRLTRAINYVDDYEKAFFLAEDIELRMYETVDDSDDAEQPTLALSWLDLSSPDASERFEFVISSQHEDCRQSEIDRVVDVAIQCIVSYLLIRC
jgi:hypothetical protein